LVRPFRGLSNAFANRLLGIDLTTLVTTFDNTAADIAAHQRDATVQRKELAQKTKDFRKLDDASKLAEIKGLLKGMLGLSEFPNSPEYG
jgi:hypothetical protein